MKLILEALRAAFKQPQRTLACLRACEGVDLDVIESHDHDYNLQHLHDQLAASTVMSQHDDRRMQQLVAERNLLTARTTALVKHAEELVAMLKRTGRAPACFELIGLDEAKAALAPFMRPTVQVVGVDTGEEC